MRFVPNAFRAPLTVACVVTVGAAAVSAGQAPAPVAGKAVSFAKTAPARLLRPASLIEASSPESGEREHENPAVRDLDAAAEATARRLGLAPSTFDPVAQLAAPVATPPTLGVTFAGINNLDNANAFGFRVLPPDTNGDVGPNHYVQTVNLLARVFNKDGTPATAPFKISTLFAALGASNTCAQTDNGDPIALYDEQADRWLISQFGFTSTLPPYHQCIAISQTSDPTGAYFAYDFVVPSDEFNDYPHFGVWPDAYYMTANQFRNFGPFDGTGAFAFDRAKMIAGDPAAGFVYFNLNLASFPEGLGGMLPADLDGPPPAKGTPNPFVYFTSVSFGDPADGLRLFDFHVDFANPAASTFTERAESTYANPVAVAAFDPTFNSAVGPCPGSAVGFTGRDDLDQPPLALLPAASCNAKLDTIADRLMYRLQYRNFGDHESLVVNHTVDVNFSAPSTPPWHAGVRYYELRREPGGAYSVNEQASWAPDGDERWMGSAAMDSNGNIAIGYSVTSATTFPSIRFAGRYSSNPPNGLFTGEGVLHTGLGSQGNSASRWGDYSSLSVDPKDGCTFWYTTEYYEPTDGLGGIVCSPLGTTSNACWSTRIGTFRFPTCIANPAASPNVLWPPNHKLVPVKIAYDAGATATCSLAVTSNQPVQSGHEPDWVVVDAHNVLLRAERSGKGRFREYTVTISCEAGAGNVNTKTVVVKVPHDQRG